MKWPVLQKSGHVGTLKWCFSLCLVSYETHLWTRPCPRPWGQSCLWSERLEEVQDPWRCSGCSPDLTKPLCLKSYHPSLPFPDPKLLLWACSALSLSKDWNPSPPPRSLPDTPEANHLFSPGPLPVAGVRTSRLLGSSEVLDVQRLAWLFFPS